jgi:hypothetical protein
MLYVRQTHYVVMTGFGNEQLQPQDSTVPDHGLSTVKRCLHASLIGILYVSPSY